MSKPRVRLRFEGQPSCPARLPMLRVPPNYEEGEYGRWTLGHVPEFDRVDEVPVILQRGYWSGLGWEPCFYNLSRGGRVWMSTSKMERESHAVHLKHARGDVVVCGAGMGLILYNLCLKPDVRRVIVVDHDRRIVDMCRGMAAHWPGVEKLSWLVMDALVLTRRHLSADFGMTESPTYLYVDIWPDMGSAKAVPQTSQIQKQLRARMVGWWTQELDFIHWCAENAIPRDEVDLNVFDRWCLELDMVICERSAGYIEYCWRVAHNAVMR